VTAAERQLLKFSLAKPILLEQFMNEPIRQRPLAIEMIDLSALASGSLSCTRFGVDAEPDLQTLAPSACI